MMIALITVSDVSNEYMWNNSMIDSARSNNINVLSQFKTFIIWSDCN